MEYCILIIYQFANVISSEARNLQRISHHWRRRFLASLEMTVIGQKKLSWYNIWFCACALLLFYSASSFGQQIRSVPDSVANKIKNQKEFLYANDPSFWQKEKQEDEPAFFKFIDAFSESSFLRWFLYIFLAAIIGFVVYQIIVNNNLLAFSKKGKKNKEWGRR